MAAEEPEESNMKVWGFKTNISEETEWHLCPKSILKQMSIVVDYQKIN
jgi:hypothetical protein